MGRSPLLTPEKCLLRPTKSQIPMRFIGRYRTKLASTINSCATNTVWMNGRNIDHYRLSNLVHSAAHLVYKDAHQDANARGSYGWPSECSRHNSRSLGMEVRMNEHTLGRRQFLKTTLIGTAGLPIASVFGSRLVSAAAGAVKTAYDPVARLEITVSEVEMRRNSAGRMLMARIYQPKGAGPFPTVLDLHGGAWNAKDRHAEEPMDRALAASGLLVVAIDMTLASEAPYPACVQDANYGVRWLKTKAASWNGDPSKIGIYGSSSGGQVAELLAMRPHDPRYNAIPLAAAANVDARVAYAAMRSPVSDPLARFKNAEKLKRDGMVKNHVLFFNPWDTIHESNPQEILDRHESVTLVPLLIMAGALDDNVLPEIQKKFVAAYKAAGGEVQFQIFEGAEHEWVANEGPQTDRAREMVKAFIARQLKT
jgi:acetyl esterase